MKFVLNRGYGGFGIPEVLALILSENFGWTIAPKDAPRDTKDYDLINPWSDLICPSKKHPDMDSFEFRCNPDLIAAIPLAKKHINDLYEQGGMTYLEYHYHPIHKLKIFELTSFNFEIEDYNDGCERLIVTPPDYEEFEDDGN